MKKIIFLSFPILFLMSKANSQITKGNWLVGGNASFSTLQSSSDASVKFRQTNFQLTAPIGYFLIDKLAAGLRPSFRYGKNSLVENSQGTTVFEIGPFARYYFLPSEKEFNIFADGSYTYGSITGGQKLNTFSFSAGPVLYFNSSVGLEFSMGYSTTKIANFSGRNNELRFGIGFQIHLEKDK